MTKTELKRQLCAQVYKERLEPLIEKYGHLLTNAEIEAILAKAEQAVDAQVNAQTKGGAV